MNVLREVGSKSSLLHTNKFEKQQSPMKEHFKFFFHFFFNEQIAVPLIRGLSKPFQPPENYLQFQNDINSLYRLVIYRDLFHEKPESFKRNYLDHRQYPENQNPYQKELLKELAERIQTKQMSIKDKLSLLNKNVHSQVQQMFQSIHNQVLANHAEGDFINSFSLIEGPSRIEQGGNGVFLKGQVLPGTVVAIYPGILVMF
jgi:hypothetical protein